MSVGNCTQISGCSQAIRVTTSNGQPLALVYNLKTKSFVDPQSQSSD